MINLDIPARSIEHAGSHWRMRSGILVFGVGVHAGPVNGTDLCCMFNEVTAFDR